MTTDRDAPALALVTGGNRGIGLEVCRQLAGAGTHVLLAARRLGDAEAAAGELRASGGPVEALALDVTDEAAIAALAERFRTAGTQPDALVNNAAVALQGFDGEVVRQTLAANLMGPWHLTDALLPLLAPRASIVMVSSGMGAVSGLGTGLQRELLDPALSREGLQALAARFQADVDAGRERQAGWPGSAYSVSKALLNGLTRVLARELAGTELRVNSVCPGWVRTRMGGEAAHRSTAQGADGIAWAAGPASAAHHGAFLRDRKPIDW